MSMTQALSRVGEIRTEIASLQEIGAPAATAGSRASTGADATARAADFASALQTAAGTSASGGGLAQTLTSMLPALSGTSSGTAKAGATSGTAGTAAAAEGAARTAPSSRAQASGAGSGTGAAAVETAKKYLGTPYVWGGESLAEGGLDCSGLVYLSYSQHGVKLPRVARDMMREGTQVPSLAEARPGDLIIQRGGRHVGMYLGDGQMIHSPRPGKTVEIASITDDRVTTIRRVVD